MAKNASVLQIRQVRSRIGQTLRQREALRTLGLRRIGQVVERPDNPAVRGIVRAIAHLVSIERPDLLREEPKTKQTSAAAVKGAGEPAKVVSAEVPATPTTTKKKAKKRKTTKKKATKKKATKKKATKKKATKKKATKKKTARKTTTKKKASGGNS